MTSERDNGLWRDFPKTPLEFEERFKTDGVARIAARVIESVAAKPPLTMRKLIDRHASHQTFSAGGSCSRLS